MIRCLETGLVYRNPKPHLRAVHAWHPCVVRLDGGELVASFDLAQAPESLDYRTYVSRSGDDGQTWESPVPLFEDAGFRRSTHSVRVGRTKSGLLIGFGARWYRDDPEEGIINRATMGMVPMDLILLTSSDAGRTWNGPSRIEPPLADCSFEICHSIVELEDGRLLAPTATWRNSNGEAPHGLKAVALVSEDQGQTWPSYLDVLDGTSEGVVHWEQSLVELPDGRLLAVAWTLDEKTGRAKPNRFGLSHDGRTFAPPRSTGLAGETAKVLSLGDDRILCLYRRQDGSGLWANLARLAGDQWTNLAEVLLWQGAVSGVRGSENVADELSDLKFGFPSMVRMPGGDVFAVFWCVEDGLGSIRWLKIRVE